MVEKIEAYKCGLTGKIFEDQRDATRSEFRSLMRRFVTQMPSGDEVTNAASVADWLSSNLEGGIYHSAVTKFLEVADYLRANRETLCSR
jgi:hypothetical protein